MQWKSDVQKELERVRAVLQSQREWKVSVEPLVARLKQDGFGPISIFERLLQGIEATIAGLERDERDLADLLEADGT